MTTDAITKEIHESITKNLPAQVGEILQGELQALADLRGRYEELQDQHDQLKQEHHVAQVALNKHRDEEKALREREAAVAKREEAVQHIEHTLALKDKDVEMYKTLSANMRDMVGLVFHSPTFRTVQSVTQPVVVPQGGSNGYITPASVQHHTASTTTTQEVS